MWPITVTDGKVIGTTALLGAYGRSDYPQFTLEKAVIKSIVPESRTNKHWEMYTLESSLGVSDLYFRTEMKPFVQQILGVESLEGVTVNAFYYENRLMGFTKTE